MTRLADLIEIRPLAIMDTKQLPLPKEDMKAVLKLIWRTTSDRKMCDRVEVSFVRLSNFQDGVGEAPLEPVVPPNSPPERVAAILDPYIAAASRVQAETHALSAEFNEFKRLFTQSGPESASVHSGLGRNRASGRRALREQN